MKKYSLILLGGGGHCKSCIDVIEATEKYEIKGILDVKEKIGQQVSGYNVINTDEALTDYVDGDVLFLITVGQIKNAEIRAALYNRLKMAGAKLATIISPAAIISPRAKIGEGTIVMHGAKVNADATIGINNIINTNTNIEHDCKTGDHVHIATNAVLNGGCSVGDKTFIGSGTIVIQNMQIGKNVFIGAGALVNRSCLEAATYVGNPVRRL